MNKFLTMSLAAASIVSGLSVGAYAALNNQLRGSDTLHTWTTSLVGSASCPGISPLTYIGGGSGNGEDAMRKREQFIAPMSSALGAARTCRSADPTKAEFLSVALDGLSIVNGEDACVNDGIAFATSACFEVTDGADTGTTVDCPECNSGTSTYCMSNWQDALRLIYAGMSKTAGNNVANKNCGGDVRRSLVAQWSEIFAGGCTGSDCTSLKHAWRRDDLSGTTEAFLVLLGLPAIASTPFCNGTAAQDLDPIRVDCHDDDDVCDALKSGLVLPIFVPEVNAAPDVTEYPVQACTPTKFALAQAQRVVINAAGDFDYICPEGTQWSVASSCLAPYFDAPGQAVSKRYDCLNTKDNKSAFTTGPTGDGRIFNKFVRKGDAAGSIVTDKAGRLEVNGYYRVRSNDGCQQISSTRNIGCLAGDYSCSIGFAGREAGEDPAVLHAKPLTVGGVFPTDAEILKLKTNDPTRYPLARFLYVASTGGVENVGLPAPNGNANEAALLACFQNQTVAGPLAAQAGFVPLGQAPICNDFNETSCNTAAYACATNAECEAWFDGSTCTIPSGATSGTCSKTCTSDADCNQPGATCLGTGLCGFSSNVNACANN